MPDQQAMFLSPLKAENARENIWIFRAYQGLSRKDLAEVLASMVTQLLEGDLDMARYQFREYIIGHMELEQIAEEVKIPAKSLSRMLGPKGNPTSQNLIKIIRSISARHNIKLRAIAEPA